MRFTVFLLVLGVLFNTLIAVSFVNPTLADNSFTSSNFLALNLSFSSDDNFSNIIQVNFQLYGSNGVLNSVNSTSSSYSFTGLNDGSYAYNVTFFNSTGAFSTETRHAVIDTVFPVVSFVSPTPNNNSFSNNNNLSVGLNVTEVNLAEITYSLFDVNGVVSVINSTDASYIFNNLADGNYTFNVSVYDKAGHLTSIQSRSVIISTSKSSISFVNPTMLNGSFTGLNSFLVNVSVNSSFLLNLTYSVVGPSYVNTTNAASTFLNFTNLNDGVYTVSVTVFDASGNTNSTSRVFGVDTVNPTGYYTGSTPNNNSYLNHNNIFIGMLYTEVNLANITYYLYNSSGLVNSTNSTRTWINFTDLNDGNYTINVTITDLAGHVFSLGSRNVFILTASPVLVTLSAFVSGANVTVLWVTFQPTSGVISCGTSTNSLTSCTSDSSLAINHSAVINSLSCGMLYYYNLQSCNLANSCIINGTFTFTTSPCANSTNNTVIPSVTANAGVSVTPTPSATITQIPDSNYTSGITSVSESKAIPQSQTYLLSTVIVYNYTLTEDVKSGDLIVLEFANLSCDDYKVGLIVFSIEPVSVSCGSVIAKFKALNLMSKGDVFSITVSLKKIINSTQIQQPTTTKVDEGSTSVNDQTEELQQDLSSPYPPAPVIIIVLALAIIVGFYFYREKKKKKHSPPESPRFDSKEVVKPVHKEVQVYHAEKENSRAFDDAPPF